MKRFFAILTLCVLLLSCCLAGTSCDDDAETAMTLYVYNWGEYISDGSEDSLDTNAEFEAYCKETLGIDVTVNYSTFSSNEDMYAKISSGAAYYDVIIPSDYMIERMVAEELVQPLDFSKLQNPSYLDFISADYLGENVYYEDAEHPEVRYSVPYFCGMMGVIYNTEYVDEEEENIGSWSLMWDDDYAGDILQFNNSRDAFGTALYYLGYDVNEATEEQWREALDLLKTQKKIVQGYVMDEIFNKMQSGSAAVAAYYAGDFLTMYEENDSLAFYYPEEGVNIYVDAMCIPTSAKHYDLALEYINFMCRPDIAVANAEYTYYTSPLDMEKVGADEEFSWCVDEYRECMEEVHEDAWDMMYGETARIAKDNPNTIAYLNLDPDRLSMVNDLWEELKVESSIGTGIYVGCGIILAAIAALIVYNVLRKRRWAKLYD